MTLLLTEMIDAADQARRLADGITVADLEQDRQRRDALTVELRARRGRGSAF